MGKILATPQKETKTKLTAINDSQYEQYKRNLPPKRTAQELMTQNIITTTPETPLEEAAKKMGDNHAGSLIVRKYKTPVGIITERDLLSKVIALGLFLADEKVEEVMSYPLVGISQTTTIKQVAQNMIDNKGRLAVFNNSGSLVGIITASDLVRSLPDVSETEVKVDEFMTKEVVTADEETPVIAIARQMGRQRIGSIIITRKKEPYGIFTERDLLTSFLAKGKTLFTDTGPECSTPITSILAGTSVHRAAATMAIKHIRRLPIASNDRLVGIITARDLVEAYAK